LPRKPRKKNLGEVHICNGKAQQVAVYRRESHFAAAGLSDRRRAKIMVETTRGNSHMSETLSEFESEILHARDEGMWITALVLVEKYLEQRPDDPRFCVVYGDILRVLCRFDEAERVLRSVPEDLRPGNYPIQLTLGRVFEGRGDFARAEQAYRNAAEMTPEYTVPIVFLASVIARQGRFEEACRTLQDGIRAEGDVDEVWRKLGDYNSVLGDLETAQHCYEMALAISPDYPEVEQALRDINGALGLRTRLSE
jgi:tetratricopeptide (TPR) repeat protein